MCVCAREESFKQFAIISIASSPPPSITNKVTHPRGPLNAHFGAAPDSGSEIFDLFFSFLVRPKTKKENARSPAMRIHSVETPLCRGDVAPFCCNFVFAFIYGVLSGLRQLTASLSQRLRQSGYAP